jgi:DNA replication protein DnaC
LINEMVETKHQLQLGRALARWARYDLIALDEVGYVPLAEVGAEFLFQVIAERAEEGRRALGITWVHSENGRLVMTMRLCKALLDRTTDRANIMGFAGTAAADKPVPLSPIKMIGSAFAM